MKHILHKACIAMLLFVVGVCSGWAGTYTYDFSGVKKSGTTYWFSDSGLKTSAGCFSSANGVANTPQTFYYKSGEAFVFAGSTSSNKAYFSIETATSSSYFLFGKNGAYITLPTFANEKITNVTIQASNSHSTSVSVNIYNTSGTVASTSQTWSTTGKSHSYNIKEANQTDQLRIQVTNANNAQLTQVVITTESIGGGSDGGDSGNTGGETPSTVIPSFSGSYIDIDLSKDETTTATADAISWSNEYFDIVNTKGTTDCTNYYPSTPSKNYTSTRFYGTSTMTFSPKEGIAITGVVYTATTNAYTTAFANSTWNNAASVADVDNKIAYLVPTNGTKDVIGTIGATTGATNIRVYYTEGETLSMSALGYATYYTNYDYVMPAGLVGKIMYSDNEAIVSGEVIAAGEVVPARTALLLKGDKVAKDYTLNVATEDPSNLTVELCADNLLKGSLFDELTAGGSSYYKFANDPSDGLGWYWGAADGAAFTNPAHKAYIAIPEGGNSPRFIAIENETLTAIESIEANANTEVYDLAGRRVKNATNGLYIVNGKKVIR